MRKCCYSHWHIIGDKSIWINLFNQCFFFVVDGLVTTLVHLPCVQYLVQNFLLRTDDRSSSVRLTFPVHILENMQSSGIYYSYKVVRCEGVLNYLLYLICLCCVFDICTLTFFLVYFFQTSTFCSVFEGFGLVIFLLSIQFFVVVVHICTSLSRCIFPFQA